MLLVFPGLGQRESRRSAVSKDPGVCQSRTEVELAVDRRSIGRRRSGRRRAGLVRDESG